LLDPEDEEGTVTFQNVRNYSPIDMLYNPRGLEPIALTFSNWIKMN
jgi:hypothetical protein